MTKEFKDRFRDWNLLHKSVVALILGFICGISYRAIIVVDGGFEMEYEAVLHYAPETIWPWVVDPKQRTDWQGELVDTVPYMGDPATAQSTRLLFWKRGYRRWQAVEMTTEVVQQRLYATIQESDTDKRWFRVELTPMGPCSTKVRLYEVIKPALYEERFWFFTKQQEAAERLKVSVGALDRWLGDTSPACVNVE